MQLKHCDQAIKILTIYLKVETILSGECVFAQVYKDGNAEQQ